MIAQLRGIVERVSGHLVVLDVNGVGYELHCSARCVEALGLTKPALIVTYTHVREDVLQLFGFADILERQVFLLLTSVQGVGPKSAAEIVSQIDKTELLRTIGTGDPTQLQKIKGIGKKLSERIIVELKDKVSEFATERAEGQRAAGPAVGAPAEAIEALQALGFQKKDAERAVQSATAEGRTRDQSVAELVREALRYV